MNKSYSIIMLFILSVLFFYNCNKEEVEGAPIPLDVKIDSSKIGPFMQDSVLAISFHPPFLWDNYNTALSERVESVKNINKSQKRKFMISPKHLFFKYGSNSLLSVGEITSLDTSVVEGDRVTDYFNMITDKNNPGKVFTANYIKDGILLWHIQTEIENLISAKYIFKSRDGKIIQFDYTFRKQNEAAESKSILSSLASIQLK